MPTSPAPKKNAQKTVSEFSTYLGTVAFHGIFFMFNYAYAYFVLFGVSNNFHGFPCFFLESWLLPGREIRLKAGNVCDGFT